MTFADIVDAADRMSADEQLTLLEILRRRLAEREREQLVRDVADARAEFAKGATRPTTVKQFLDEVGYSTYLPHAANAPRVKDQEDTHKPPVPKESEECN